MVKSLPEVEVASTIDGPVCGWPWGPSAVMPPPAPASTPQENWPVDESYKSLPEEGLQVESPAPLIIEVILKFVVVAFASNVLPVSVVDAKEAETAPVRPPLNAIDVVVAFDGNGYANVA